MTDRRVVFTPSGKRGAFADGTSLLDAARRLGVDLDSVCGGRGVCGRCQVDIAEGSFAKHALESRADHVSPWSAVEQRFVDKRGAFPPERRLGCQATICGDLVVDVPPESQVHRQVVRKPAEERAIVIDPVVRLHTVAVREPDMRDPASDFRRLQEALAEQWGVAGATADLAVLKTLQGALRAGGWTVTVALRNEREIVAISPGFAVNAYGVAVDVGSTTIAAYLCDLSSGAVLASVGAMNPQIRFGEDLMSRVSYAMMHPDGAAEMTRVVREAVDALIGEAASEAGVARQDIVEVTLVGNPIMHHLALGLDPTELGSAPFALAIDGAAGGQGPRPRPRDRARRHRLRAALHRRPCRRGRGGRRAGRGAPSWRRAPADRRRRHQRRDRVRRPRAAHRRLVADRAGLRGRADLLRPARRPRRDRASAHRPGDPSSPASR